MRPIAAGVIAASGVASVFARRYQRPNRAAAPANSQSGQPQQITGCA